MSKGLARGEVTPTPKIQLPIRLEAEQYARLRKAAFDRDESMTTIVQRALEIHLNDAIRRDP